MFLSSKDCYLCHKVVDFDFDFCALLKLRTARGSFNLIQKAFRGLKKFGNFPPGCPFEPVCYFTIIVVIMFKKNLFAGSFVCSQR